MEISMEFTSKDFGNNIEVVVDYGKQSKVSKPLTLEMMCYNINQREACKIDFLGWNWKRLWILQLNTCEVNISMDR
jgi:hypothetical protein